MSETKWLVGLYMVCAPLIHHNCKQAWDRMRLAILYLPQSWIPRLSDILPSC